MEIKTRATEILKDYIKQMRFAGYRDSDIREKLLETGSVFVPNELPESSQRYWTGGMSNEIAHTEMPTPNTYMEYMPGGVANRMPTYEEYRGNGVNTGKFKNIQNENLIAALQRRLQNYSGPTVGASQYAYESGMVGLPQDLANYWYPQYQELEKQKEAAGAANEEYEQNLIDYAKYGIKIKPTDTPEDIADMIIRNVQTSQEPTKSQVIQDIIEGFSAGQGTVEDAYRYAVSQGIVLNIDDIEELYYRYFPNE